MRKVLLLLLLLITCVSLSAQTKDDITRTINTMKVFDCNGDGLLTDLDYCVRFIDNWQWKGTSFDTRNVVLVRCWVSNTAYRHLIVLTVWTGTEMDWIVVDPLYRVAPENYVSYTDITEQWQYWFWGGA